MHDGIIVSTFLTFIIGNKIAWQSECKKYFTNPPTQFIWLTPTQTLHDEYNLE